MTPGHPRARGQARSRTRTCTARRDTGAGTAVGAHAADPVTPAIYRCLVTHVRTGPVRHTVRHRTYLWLTDLDAPPRLPRVLRPLARFESRDHFAGTAPTLRAGLERFLAARGVPAPTGRVLMLTNARVLGYVFNPLTLYWCHAADSTPTCVVAEVHNTYGERHCYLLHTDAAGVAEVAKEFYVSPFFPVDGGYRMRVPLPDERLRLTVQLDRSAAIDAKAAKDVSTASGAEGPDAIDADERDAPARSGRAAGARQAGEPRQAGGARPFTATVRGERRPADAWSLLRTVLRHPWETAVVSAAIRLHGIALYLRGLPVRPRPRHRPQEGVE